MSNQLTDLARSLKQRAKELGYEIKHTHALELLSAIDGNRNRHVLKTYAQEALPSVITKKINLLIVDRETPEDFQDSPFEIVLKHGIYEIRRTDGKDMGEIYYPSFTLNIDGKQLNNRDVKDFGFRLKNRRTHYNISFYSKDKYDFKKPKKEILVDREDFEDLDVVKEVCLDLTGARLLFIPE